jgi:hypothetical protein
MKQMAVLGLFLVVALVPGAYLLHRNHADKLKHSVSRETLETESIGPGIAVPGPVEVRQFGCQDGYIGVWFSTANAWDNDGGAMFSSGGESLKVCITPEFLRRLHDAQKDFVSRKTAITGTIPIQ